ncbi:unnamed protein product [Cylicocyclus nassatus]|uniref:Uncharacterized protein n=1 Tax=Cylicocyclus nassatus TaxID=53992 RepID=A0AA36GUG4_CYLNA|nr:unnamed protein product [Cylicocyclus nassatus]
MRYDSRVTPNDKGFTITYIAIEETRGLITDALKRLSVLNSAAECWVPQRDGSKYWTRYPVDGAEQDDSDRNNRRSLFAYLGRCKLTWNALFLLVLIVGATLAVILTVVLSGRSSPSQKDTRIVYFSMYIGDGEQRPPLRFKRSLGYIINNHTTSCNFETNKNNTENAIGEIAKRKDIDQRYSFIFYGDEVQVTKPLKARDAVDELKSTQSKSQFIANQSAAIEQFLEKTKGRTRDILFHFIPCNCTVLDPETTKFVNMMKQNGIGKRTTLVSNTQNSTVIKAALNLTNDDIEGVIGTGDDVVKEITDIGNGEVDGRKSEGVKWVVGLRTGSKKMRGL